MNDVGNTIKTVDYNHLLCYICGCKDKTKTYKKNEYGIERNRITDIALSLLRESGQSGVRLGVSAKKSIQRAVLPPRNF